MQPLNITIFGIIAVSLDLRVVTIVEYIYIPMSTFTHLGIA